MRTLLQLVKANLVLLVNAGSLIGTTVVTSILGFAYWWLAARLFSPLAVGFASAAISVMMLLGTLCMMGLGTLLTGELARQQGQEGALISAALIVVGVIGVGVGILLAIVAPLVSPDFRPLGASVQNIVIFALGVSLTTITLVLDQALIGLLRGNLQFWRNALFAAVKLGALFGANFWLWQETGMALYTTWLVGNCISLLALLVVAIKNNGRRSISWPQWHLMRKLGASALQHHMLNLIMLAPPLVFPILITIEISVIYNAWFYVSFMLINFVYGVPYALSTALYAVGSAQPTVVAHKTRVALGISLSTGVVATFVLFFGSKFILGFFGPVYAEQASSCLRILGIAVFPITIMSHYIAIRRIRGRIVGSMVPITIGTLLEIIGAAIGAHLGGLSGLSIGWLISLCCEAAYMFPTVYQAVRPGDASPSEQSDPARDDVSSAPPGYAFSNE